MNSSEPRSDIVGENSLNTKTKYITSKHITRSERNIAIFCHMGALLMSFLAPLAIILLKKHESEFIRYHARESCNFQFTILLCFAISLLLKSISFIGVLLLVGFLVFDLVVIIIASVKNFSGGYYRYPFSINIIK